MIWSLDIYSENNLSVIHQIRKEIDFENRKPCIYVVRNDVLIIYGTGAKIEIDFRTKMLNYDIFNQISLDNKDDVKKFYWGSVEDEEISKNFVVNYSKMTESLCHIVEELYDDNLGENILEATQNHCSYKEYGKGYRFFRHEPNNHLERNKKELTSLEDILKRWVNFKNQSRDITLPKVEDHAGVSLLNFLKNNGIMKYMIRYAIEP